MIIEISDNLSGFERRKQLHQKVVIYAIKKFGCNTGKAAKFLGTSRRTIYNFINQDDLIRSAYQKEKLKKKIKNILKKSSPEKIFNSYFYKYSTDLEKSLMRDVIKSEGSK